jgi:hypothetical protein
MCIFTKLYLGHTLWSEYGKPLSEMVKILGPLPQLWYGDYHKPNQNDPSWYDQSQKPEVPLEDMIKRTCPEVSAAELSHVL